ncbi:notchless protein homolog 1-like [Dysidea avara]|uniref:notchless protein homolog 1-like n=1 Tax=Dysidea avara TaxID=196820 RepID=UPI0033291F4C
MPAHCHWILSIAWSPDGKKIASGCKAGTVCIWDSVTGKQLGKFLTGHRQWITWLSWRPMHQTLSGYGHWVNTLCLNTDYVLRTGPYESANDKPEGDLHQ